MSSGQSSWEEIHGFSTPEEYLRFVEYIEEHTTAEHAKEIAPEASYRRGILSGGRWFRDVSSGEVWRLIEPEFPFRGTWERVQFEKSITEET